MTINFNLFGLSSSIIIPDVFISHNLGPRKMHAESLGYYSKLPYQQVLIKIFKHQNILQSKKIGSVHLAVSQSQLQYQLEDNHFYLILQLMKPSEEVQTTATTACDNGRCQWPIYAKMLFPSDQSHRELLSVVEQEILCSPRQTLKHSQKVDQTAYRISSQNNAFCDFLKGVIDQKQNQSCNQNPLVLALKKIDPQLPKAQMQQSPEICQCFQLLRGFYNEKYAQTKVRDSLIPSIQNSYSPKVQILNPFKFNKTIHETQTKQIESNFEKLGFTCFFNKDEGCLYYLKSNSDILLKQKIERLQYSETVCLDAVSERFFLFENTKKQIHVFCFKSQTPVCKFKSFVDRLNPSLYFHQKNSLLFIAGGYSMESSQIIASNKLQIYRISSTALNLEPIIINLGMKRFKPILNQAQIDDQSYFFAIGGIKKAQIVNQNLIYNKNSKQNQETNSTAEVVNIDKMTHTMIHINNGGLKLCFSQNMYHEGEFITMLLESSKYLKFTLNQQTKSNFQLKIQILEKCPCKISELYNRFFCNLKSSKQSEKQSEQKSGVIEKGQISKRTRQKSDKICCPII